MNALGTRYLSLFIFHKAFNSSLLGMILHLRYALNQAGKKPESTHPLPKDRIFFSFFCCQLPTFG